ncbi:MAG: peptide deformylase [Proteobacteria bacterium]|nr:peptide deformylase [Pseudomonadota bacterium]
MAILKIARMGHPVLRGKAADIADPGAPEIRRLIGDMMETLADAGGAGLAAPQVHQPLRVVIFHIPPEGPPEGPNEEPEEGADEGAEEAQGTTRPPPEPPPGPPQILINPVIEPIAEEMEIGWEGCLSVPGLRGLVPRFTAIRYRGLDGEGAAVERTASGFHARVVQHECDHLDGILYPMRMPDLSLLGFEEELDRYRLAIEDEEPAGEDEAPQTGPETGPETGKIAAKGG